MRFIYFSIYYIQFRLAVLNDNLQTTNRGECVGVGNSGVPNKDVLVIPYFDKAWLIEGFRSQTTHFIDWGN